MSTSGRTTEDQRKSGGTDRSSSTTTSPSSIDLEIVLVDPLRPGHETGWFPGEVNLRRADVVVINKANAADSAAVAALEESVRRANPAAEVVRTASAVTADGDPIAGRRVLVVEDGPSVTHGSLPSGAGLAAALRYGAAEVVDPRPWVAGSIASAYARYPPPRPGPSRPGIQAGAGGRTGGNHRRRAVRFSSSPPLRSTWRGSSGRSGRWSGSPARWRRRRGRRSAGFSSNSSAHNRPPFLLTFRPPLLPSIDRPFINCLGRGGELMIRCDYVIIGGGMAADAAAKGIREIDPDGTIAIIAAERHPPYARPPLTKKLWTGKPLESVWRGTDQLPRLTLRTCRRALRIDRHIKTVIDDTGTTWSYGKLLLATGGVPRRLPFGGDDIVYFRTLDDYTLLRDRLSAGRSFAVIGGGFIGSEIAAALAMNGADVTMVIPEPGICSRIFPPDVIDFLNLLYREKGVKLLTNESVTGFRQDGNDSVLVTGSGEVRAGCVVAGIGIEPEVSLALQAGLPVENGIVVDGELRAGDPEIFAAGDVASFFSPILGRRMRVEHEDSSIAMGRQAGRNMAGAGEEYRHLPFFYSDLFDVGYEAVGELDSRLEVVADWKEPYREGVLYYLREGAVRGILLWNVWDQVDNARAIIAEHRTRRPEELRGLLPR